MTVPYVTRLVILSRESPASCYLARQLNLFNGCELQAIICENTTFGRLELLRKKFVMAFKRKGAGAAISLLAETPYLFWRERQSVNRQKRAWGLFTENKYPAEIPRHIVESLNNDATRALLKQYQPDLLFVFGTRILKSHVFNSSRHGAINLHTGITPEYRGAKSEFWALYRNDLEMVGFTIHCIDEGIDTGGVILQRKIDVREDDDDINLRIRNIEAAAPEIERVITKMHSLRGSIIPTEGRHSEIFSTPTMRQYMSLKWVRRRNKRVI